MNILIINTSDINGGAAIAANRLFNALKSYGLNVKMIVFEKNSTDQDIICAGSSLEKKFNFYSERGEIFLYNRFSKNNLFEISTAGRGLSITETEEYKQADIIHMHWINQGMLSIKEIKKIVASGKKVVWTMHDMWPFTGICHYSGDCDHYIDGCGNCPLLKHPANNDLSKKIFSKKLSAYFKGEINFVACSNWLKDMAEESPLTVGHHVTSIPNPIDIEVYRPLDKTSIRKKLNLPNDKKIVLFAAVKASDNRKGLSYLAEATKLLKNHSNELLFIIAGSKSNDIEKQLSIPSQSVGYISPEYMPNLYNAVDLFVSPSLQDNLPNTIMEALSCGTPCVGFNTGGIPEMIDHQHNGYVAEYRNSTDLASGIRWSLFEADHKQLSDNARKKVVVSYNNNIIAGKYIEIYKNARG